ncbi:MAG TPA: hypothetical protein VF993_04405 [Myxococcales bacterium]
MRRTAIALALLACAPARKPFGELSVSAVHEFYPLAVVHEAVFRIESGRIVEAGASAGALLDLVATDDGCLRGDTLGRPLYFCPTPGDAKGVYRWRSVTRQINSFSTQLLDFGDKLRIETSTAVAELPLPAGPAGDEVRRHPELLGAAFAIGRFPASADSRELWAYQVKPR